MYKANLSYEVLTKYLDYLLEYRFLVPREGHYFLSRRGLIYLERFANYQRSKQRVELSENKIKSILPGDPSNPTLTRTGTPGARTANSRNGARTRTAESLGPHS